MAARRERLLDAAERCFMRRGVEATTMRHILDEAGVSAGGVYVHFASKAAIVAALAQRVSARDQTMIRRCLVPGDPAATLAQIFTLAFADWRERGAKDRVRLDVAMLAEALRNPAVAKLTRASMRAAIAAIAGVLAEAESGAGAKAGAAHLARARAVAALFLGVPTLWHADPSSDPTTLESVLTQLTRALSEVRP